MVIEILAGLLQKSEGVPFKQIEKLAILEMNISPSAGTESPGLSQARDEVWRIEDLLARYPQYGNRNELGKSLEKAQEKFRRLQKII